jgi:hypothetical protein
VTTTEFLDEVAGSLRGPRRRRQRLIEELQAHIEDGVRAALEPDVSVQHAERHVLDQLGTADQIAHRWNADQRALQGKLRRRLAAVAFAAVVAAALGVTQYAAGKPQSPRHPVPTDTTRHRVTHGRYDRH